MSHKYWVAVAVCLMIGLLAACNSAPPIDPQAVDVNLTTEPAAADGETKLVAELTGIDFPEATVVQFDVRVDLIPRLLDSVSEGGDVYSASYKFPQAGIYDVYIHIYIEDLHLTKLKQVEVQ